MARRGRHYLVRCPECQTYQAAPIRRRQATWWIGCFVCARPIAWRIDAAVERTSAVKQRLGRIGSL